MKSEVKLSSGTRNKAVLSAEGGYGDIIRFKTCDEWAQKGNKVSEKGIIYIYTDFRKSESGDVPALKIGDGKTTISKLPFASLEVKETSFKAEDKDAFKSGFVSGRAQGRCDVVNEPEKFGLLRRA